MNAMMMARQWTIDDIIMHRIVLLCKGKDLLKYRTGSKKFVSTEIEVRTGNSAETSAEENAHHFTAQLQNCNMPNGLFRHQEI